MSVTDRIHTALTTVIRLETVLELALHRSSGAFGRFWKRMATQPTPDRLAGPSPPAPLPRQRNFLLPRHHTTSGASNPQMRHWLAMPLRTMATARILHQPSRGGLRQASRKSTHRVGRMELHSACAAIP